MKLRTEKQQLLEAKESDFERLKKRLKNAEAELKKTHSKQLTVHKQDRLTGKFNLALTNVHGDEMQSGAYVPRPPSR